MPASLTALVDSRSRLAEDLLAAWKRRAERQAAGDDPGPPPLRLPPTPAPGLTAYLKSQLARGHCAVLIDAWDEVPPEPVGEGGVIRGLPGYHCLLYTSPSPRD